MRWTASLLALALATTFACGGDPGASVDGGVDAAPHGDLVRVDLRGQRGAPLAGRDVDLTGGQTVFAASAAGFATTAACEPGRCDYAWYDERGARLRGRRLTAVMRSIVSPDATRMVVVDETARGECGPERHTVIEGSLEVVSLADGTASRAVRARTNVWNVPGWSGYGGWLYDTALPSDACTASPGLLAAAPPHAPATLAPDVDVVAELPDGHWLASRGPLGIVDPRAPGSFVAWPDDVESDRLVGGWLHATGGFGSSVERVHARPPGGPDRVVPAPDPDHFYQDGPSWGRLAMTCAPQSDTDGTQACLVVDLERTWPTRPLTILPRRRLDLAFLDGRAVVAENRAADGTLQLERLDLASGARDILATGDVTVTPLGDGEAALAQHAGGVLLIEADHVETLTTGAVAQVVALPPPRGTPRLPQHALAVVIESLAPDARRLLLVDLARRELVTLTDALYHSPRLQLPLAFDDCGQPWTLRTAGLPFEQEWQAARWFFFTETPPAPGAPYPLYVLPLDRSSPPRPLGDAGVAPVNCHAPLASPDGGHLVLGVDVDAVRSRVRLARP